VASSIPEGIAITLTIDGMVEVQKLIDDLSEKAANRVMRNVLRAASTVVLKEVRKITPVKTGRLKKGWIRKFSKSYSKNLYAVVKNVAKHAGLYEFGTLERETESGASRGISPPHPFLRWAVEAHRDQIELGMVKKAEQGIIAEWKKLDK